MSSVTTTRDIVSVDFMLLRQRDLTSYTLVPFE